MARIAQFNIRLKPSKCIFGMRSVEFSGHIFDENGVPHKRVKGIQDIPTLTSGLPHAASWDFQDFIPSLSYLVPLTELTKNINKIRSKWFPKDGERDMSLQNCKGSSGTSYVQGPHERLRSSNFVYKCFYLDYRRISDASLWREREASRLRLAHVVRPSN